MNLSALLTELQRRQIRLQLKAAEQGPELHLQAPKGQLTPELQQALKAHKPQLLELLQQAPRMDFSLFFFGTASGHQGNYELVLEAALRADQAGLKGIWCPERHFHDLGGPFPNPAVLMAALAMQTQQLRLRAGSVVLPLQDPIRVAEAWAMVDCLSQGRVELSFASGWHAQDFVFAPEHYPQRQQVMLQRVPEVQALWRGESTERLNPQGQTIKVQTFPRPRQPELPTWLTAIGNPSSYQQTGALGASLLTCLLSQSIDELAQKLPLYWQALTQRQAPHAPNNHQPQPRVGVFLHTCLGVDREALKALVREPFRAYLGQTLHLLGNLSQQLSLGLNPDHFSEAEKAELLDFAFESYFAERSLMGDLEDGLQMVKKLAAIGVQEVACLIDFGLSDQQVLAQLDSLLALAQLCQPAHNSSPGPQPRQSGSALAVKNHG